MVHSQNDVLHDKLSRLVVSIGLPLCSAAIVTIFTTSAVNNIYGRYAGQTAFSVMGSLNMLLGAVTNLLGCISTSAWIKAVGFYKEKSLGIRERHCINSFYVMLFVAIFFIVVLTASKDAIFRIMSVPVEIYEEATEYFFTYMCNYLFIGAGTFLYYVSTAQGSRRVVLITSLFQPFSLVITAYIFLGILDMGIKGVALAVTFQSILQILVNYCLLRRQGVLGKFKKEDFRPNTRNMLEIVRYGLVLMALVVFVNLGEVLLSLQTNRYLNVAYIAVIAVELPLNGVMGVASKLCTAVIPQNYQAGKIKRVKQFIRLLAMIVAVYSVLCCIAYRVLGRWYFSSLFDDVSLVEAGVEYWLWYGFSMIPLGLLYVFRFFFDSIGQGKISLLAGIGEIIGKCVCAFWLIPYFGVIGRYVAPLLSWGLGALPMIIAYIFWNKRTAEVRYSEN